MSGSLSGSSDNSEESKQRGSAAIGTPDDFDAHTDLIVAMVDPKPPKIYGLIPRYGRGRLLRWSVSITRRGEHFDKEFRVATYGDPEKAKAAAIAYRDGLLKEVPAMSRRDFATIVRANNTSGTPGVMRREENGFARWCAVVSLPNGKTRMR